MVEPRRAVAGERLLGEGIGQFCPLIRHYVEHARLVPAGFFLSPVMELRSADLPIVSDAMLTILSMTSSVGGVFAHSLPSARRVS
jgi:hypothetical protein